MKNLTIPNLKLSFIMPKTMVCPYQNLFCMAIANLLQDRFHQVTPQKNIQTSLQLMEFVGFQKIFILLFFIALERALPKMLKKEKADRKARSRGVSGCSTKKDGNG